MSRAAGRRLAGETSGLGPSDPRVCHCRCRCSQVRARPTAAMTMRMSMTTRMTATRWAPTMRTPMMSSSAAGEAAGQVGVAFRGQGGFRAPGLSHRLLLIQVGKPRP